MGPQPLGPQPGKGASWSSGGAHTFPSRAVGRIYWLLKVPPMEVVVAGAASGLGSWAETRSPEAVGGVGTRHGLGSSQGLHYLLNGNLCMSTLVPFVSFLNT